MNEILIEDIKTLGRVIRKAYNHTFTDKELYAIKNKLEYEFVDIEDIDNSIIDCIEKNLITNIFTVNILKARI